MSLKEESLAFASLEVQGQGAESEAILMIDMASESALEQVHQVTILA